MKLSQTLFPIALLLCLFVSSQAHAGQFTCDAQHLVQVTVSGQFSDSDGHPLTGDILTIIQDEPLSLHLSDISTYTNTVTSGGQHQLRILSQKPGSTQIVFDLEVTNNTGTLSFDKWGVYFDHVPAECQFK